MGAGVSKQQIGERVKSAKKKLSESSQIEEAQYERLCKLSPETLTNMVESVEKALLSYSPFPESTILLAFRADPERVKKALTQCTQKVLTAPIKKERYQWFMQYVFPSTVWFKKVSNGDYLYREMMRITDAKQKQIIQNMDAVYDHLKVHSKWRRITSIKNQTVVSRQDDDAVGLLQEAGIRDILEQKQSDDESEDIESIKNYIDNNLAVNILMTTAKQIDREFQQEMANILSRHGDFKPGPMKKVERALSKMENDYINEEYPKAAKLLDIVRCSASYNTIGQLFDGYRAFTDHIGRGISSMTIARVKNGFLDNADGGYRDIKVNVVYQSTLNPELKMICEVQFILNQYLYEKKRVHKLYSIAREQTYFDMVALEGDELKQQQHLKTMKFDPILNVRDDINLNHSADNFFKSSIESDLGLLGMNGGYDIFNPDSFFCVNMATKQLIFQHDAIGKYTHHWITINDQKYLSLQTTTNTISYFRVSDDHQFEEDESMKIVLNDDDVINFCEYDQSFDHIFIVRNSTILEKRALSDLNTVTMSIELESRIGDSVSKLLSMSNDGKFCVIGTGKAYSSGGSSNFFYLISLETQEQFKLNMKKLSVSYAPCFINGDSNFVAIGGNRGGEGVEIWSVGDKEMVKFIECEDNQSMVTCTYSANGILAVGFTPVGSSYLQLYNVSTWEKLYRQEFSMSPRSLFLTVDLKYLVAGGTDFQHRGKEKCIVHEIQ